MCLFIQIIHQFKEFFKYNPVLLDKLAGSLRALVLQCELD